MFDDEPPPPRRRLRAGAVHKATKTELADLGVDPKANASAATALRLASEVDSSTDAKATAAVSRELRQAMQTVRALAPPKERGDKIDQLAARRATRGA
ncbi:hypothetical protein JHN55_07025 [Streptomyces sp. MBT56]|uniref:hypothetical protein n=1 Tax=unclassified Streptomyces TaxID=2593676 RepID=UPI00190DCA46|nr:MULTISPECIES: hypothetical protein [unclassified Streptomyces]MBK3556291.1 hypothetical protein [Streptomyces sp. MBT56]MBK3601243.1 hypothetical protein [Streptomyces sp. MBT54]MBK3614521.1 hypothetical protein [Streptomyces sp. MBT98]MBK6042834.1 hypothetical protein [Streptomyces sp. MBT55]